jgi:alkylation response protein AidB-like acyl-CoA dehydrogenase
MSTAETDNNASAAILETVDRFVRDELAPCVEDMEARREFPRSLYRGFADLGLLELFVPDHDQDREFAFALSLGVLERLAAESVSFAVSVANCSDCAAPIAAGGSDEIRRRYIPRIRSGELVPAFCLSESSGGSDVAAMTTRAIAERADYIIRGRKAWVTSAPAADVFVVFAKTDVSAAHKGISAFVVDRDAPGLTVGATEQLLGLYASPTAEVSFDDVRVESGARLGPEGTGFALAMSTLDESRLQIAAVATGSAGRAVETAVDYARERKQFGKALIEHQGLGFILADMVTEFAQARALLGAAASTTSRTQGQEAGLHAAMAKLVCSNVAMASALTAAQVLGAVGLTKAYPIERLIRDSKALQILEGTNEIQKWLIAREIAKSGFARRKLGELVHRGGSAQSF